MLTALPVQCELGQMTGAIIDIHLVFIVFAEYNLFKAVKLKNFCLLTKFCKYQHFV